MVFANLDLGDTIWLNVPISLIKSFTKLFNRGEDSEDFRNIRDVLVNHHSHIHPNWTGNTDTVAHGHTGYSGSYTCLGPHSHLVPTLDAGSHYHGLQLSFGAVDLGSPWYNHRHPVSLVSISSAGGLHSHSWRTTSGGSRCSYCATLKLPTHTHTIQPGSTTSTNDAHTHTITGIYTDVAISTDTPENHRHNFAFSSDAGGSHTHGVSSGGLLASATCAGGYSHSHTAPSSLEETCHYHYITGTTGYGGEPLPAIIKRILMDGFVFAEY